MREEDSRLRKWKNISAKKQKDSCIQKVSKNERGSEKTTKRWSHEQSIPRLPPDLRGGTWRNTVTVEMEGKPTHQQHQKPSPEPRPQSEDIAKG